MLDTVRYDWTAIAADPRFQELHRKKTLFLWGLMVFSVAFYFLLPVARYFRTCSGSSFRSRQRRHPVRAGGIRRGVGIAFIYARRANTEFDTMAASIVRGFRATLQRAAHEPSGRPRANTGARSAKVPKLARYALTAGFVALLAVATPRSRRARRRQWWLAYVSRVRRHHRLDDVRHLSYRQACQERR
jgi:uncharacterized membrane protein (DUF485 family)